MMTETDWEGVIGAFEEGALERFAIPARRWDRVDRDADALDTDMDNWQGVLSNRDATFTPFTSP